MAVPNFLGIGAQRAGTTYLHTLLSRHPELVLPQEGTDPWNKEQHFFSRKVLSEDLREYERRFEDVTKPWARMCGEVTPAYAALPYSVVRAMSGYVRPGATRILLVIRNPVDRIISNLKMARHKRGGEEPERLFGLVRAAEQPGCVARTNYVWTLNNWARVYGSDHIKVVTFDQLVNRPVQTLQAVARFLEIDPEWFSEETVRRGKVHASTNEEMPAILRRYLIWRWQPLTDGLRPWIEATAAPWMATLDEQAGVLGRRERGVFKALRAAARARNVKKALSLTVRHRRLRARLKRIRATERTETDPGGGTA